MLSNALLNETGPDPLRAMGIVALNGMFDEMDANSVIGMAANELLRDDLAVVSSFGADSVALLHFVAQVNPNLPVFFLETGKHFEQTLTYVETLKNQLGLTDVRTLLPDATDLSRFDPEGTLWESDPDSCCHIRKTEPLNDALSQFGGWITGRKRFQTSERGVLPHFELTSDDRIKINPLAYWSSHDIDAYKKKFDLPEHPLLEEGFASIGCAPCTSVVAEGEDPRAGRWRGLNKAECGIHFDFNGKIAKPVVGSAMKLFKDGGFIADPWGSFEEGSDLSAARYVHIPLSEVKDSADALNDNKHPIGLLINSSDSVEEIVQELGRFSSIAISFPAFGDGRGYSTARLLRERYGYEGEIRAVGDVLTDQIPLMSRCGIDAFVVENAATKKALEEGDLAEVKVYMQPVGQTEVPVGTRPFLRRAAEPLVREQ